MATPKDKLRDFNLCLYAAFFSLFFWIPAATFQLDGSAVNQCHIVTCHGLRLHQNMDQILRISTQNGCKL